ncbi:MAG TPA: IS1595 family transposase [Bryobacteraceae bacterium]|nr:IS1595 family transposase [Bryobacteraceae bacterium]
MNVAAEYDSEEKCLDYLEAVRWPQGVRCIGARDDGSICGSHRIASFATREGVRTNGCRIPPRRLYQCRDCGYQFSARTGTLFNDSHLPLTKWFVAVALVTTGGKRMTAAQLQRDLKVGYETAWYVFHRIHAAMHGESGAADYGRSGGLTPRKTAP